MAKTEVVFHLHVQGGMHVYCKHTKAISNVLVKLSTPPSFPAFSAHSAGEPAKRPVGNV